MYAARAVAASLGAGVLECEVKWSGERADIGGVVYTAGRDTVIKVWNPKDGGMLKPGPGTACELSCPPCSSQVVHASF